MRQGRLTTPPPQHSKVMKLLMLQSCCLSRLYNKVSIWQMSMLCVAFLTVHCFHHKMYLFVTHFGQYSPALSTKGSSPEVLPSIIQQGFSLHHKLVFSFTSRSAFLRLQGSACRPQERQIKCVFNCGATMLVWEFNRFYSTCTWSCLDSAVTLSDCKPCTASMVI